MKPWLLILLLISTCLALGSGCRQSAPQDVLASVPLQVGALYSFSDGEGGFRAGKVIVVEEDVTFVHLFEKRWTKRPALDAASKATTPAPIAFTTETIAGMQPVFLQSGDVSAEESQAYVVWRQSRQKAL